MLNILVLSPLWVGVGGGLSCTQIDCPVQNMVFTRYMLLKPDGTPDTLRTDTLSIFTTRTDMRDTVLINRQLRTTMFDLPISYNADADTMYFVINDTLKRQTRDVVIVEKENTPHFESIDCHPTYFHKLTAVKYSTNAIESVMIYNPNVNYDTQQPHILLFFKEHR